MAIFFLIVFSAVAIAYSAMSSSQTMISANTARANHALMAAESGYAVIRYNIGGLQFDGDTTSDEIFAGLGQAMADAFNGTLNANGQSVTVTSSAITIATMSTDSARPGATFDARFTRDGSNILLSVTGHYGGVDRTVQVTVVEAEGPLDLRLLNHGIASKGALRFDGGAIMRSNLVGGAAVLSMDTGAFRPIRVNGSATLEGDFYMVKDGIDPADVFSSSNVQFQNADGTGYETNIADHVHDGIEAPAWPTIDTAPYATLIAGLPHTLVTSDTDTSSMDTLSNTYIQANANPTFKSGVTIQGLIYVEWPNDITFNGSSTITGMIVCQGPPYAVTEDQSANNDIRFNGAVTSSGVENLPDTPEYAGLHEHTGSFLLAPDYEVEFNGHIGTVNGTIYVSELDMNGTTTGTVRGAILVDRNRQFTKLQSVDLYFEKDPDADIPAGLVFDKYKVLKVLPETWKEL